MKALDVKQFGRVAVLFGGTAAERPISLISGAAVLKALQAVGVDAHGFDPAERDIVEVQGFDRAFIVLHGRGGEDGVIQGVLEQFGVPYTGSGVMASAIGMDKARTKQLWLGCGLPTPTYRRLHAGMDFAGVVEALGLPLMVKPAREGSSIGMAKVYSVDELARAYEVAAGHDGEVIAEHFIEGSEYTVAILHERALPVIRMIPAKDFYDFEAKYQRNDTQYRIPCGLAAEEEQQLQQIALEAFQVLGARGWGRIDAMRDRDGRFWLLEINTVPGMTDHSLVPMAAKAAGMDFTDLVLAILAGTLA
ncbi:D-alanine--D-alanine ligase [Perlucidibaca piscinae]|uniref:D-alanine--D-alanine ligase n=1 Tax=Perlucidibaca piscinae TaxID=392589 RepID=UPI0003B4BA08|nr:D-alanine--D-alanine ligase [Perlucidibaca piscinae]